MCGINGINWKGRDTILSMNNSIKHRGPDDSGFNLDKKFSLGHVRLSILDLSKKGHQPMFYSKKSGAFSARFNSKNISKKDLSIVFNGEIYNFEKIKKILKKKGYNFSTKTDTEVILASYLEWGMKCVKRFHGMWAFCIKDKEKLFLSRDRIGVKPLYYYHNKDKFIFSSEIKGILSTGVKRMPDEKTIFDFLYYNFRDHERNTFFKKINRLMPGENMIFDLNKNKLSLVKYYKLEDEIKREKNNNKNFKNLLMDSAKERLVSDVEVGVTLSGGLDSSSVVCLMDKAKCRKPIKSFSLVFPGKKIDESKFQKIIEENIDIKRFTTTFNEEDIIKDMDDFVYLHEEPLKSFSQYAQYKVMSLANKNEIKIVLEGQGADEILAGYYWFYSHLLLEYFFKLKWITMTKEFISLRNMKLGFNPMGNALAAAMPIRISKFIWKKRMNHINFKYFKKYNKRKVKDIQWKAKTLNELSFVAETYSTLPELLTYGDKNSMRWSVESRVPFCDYQVVEYVLKSPAEEKIKNGRTKHMLRESMRGILPEEILNRKDKLGFATPDEKMLVHPKIKKEFEEMLESKIFKSIKYWNHEEVKRRYSEHVIGEKNNSRELFKIFLFYKWWVMYIKKA